MPQPTEENGFPRIVRRISALVDRRCPARGIYEGMHSDEKMVNLLDDPRRFTPGEYPMGIGWLRLRNMMQFALNNLMSTEKRNNLDELAESTYPAHKDFLTATGMQRAMEDFLLSLPSGLKSGFKDDGTGDQGIAFVKPSQILPVSETSRFANINFMFDLFWLDQAGILVVASVCNNEWTHSRSCMIAQFLAAVLRLAGVGPVNTIRYVWLHPKSNLRPRYKLTIEDRPFGEFELLLSPLTNLMMNWAGAAVVMGVQDDKIWKMAQVTGVPSQECWACPVRKIRSCPHYQDVKPQEGGRIIH